MDMIPHGIPKLSAREELPPPGLDEEATLPLQSQRAEAACGRADGPIRLSPPAVATAPAPEDAAARGQARAWLVLDSIADAVVVVGEEDRVDYLNPVAEALTGWKSEAARGLLIEKVCRLINEQTRQPVRLDLDGRPRSAPPGHGPRRLLLCTADGRELAVQESVAPLRDGSRGAVIVLRDVHSEREAALELSYRASHDALTGLANRYEAEQRIARLVERARRDGSQHALAFLDLDQFKTINDTCGHAAGDELLRQFARIAQAHVRARDTVARIGGDEFVVLLEYCPLGRAQSIAEQLLKTLETFHFRWRDRRFRIGASVGLVGIGQLSEEPSALLAIADAACYVAKGSGRNRLVVRGLPAGRVAARAAAANDG